MENTYYNSSFTAEEIEERLKKIDQMENMIKEIDSREMSVWALELPSENGVYPLGILSIQDALSKGTLFTDQNGTVLSVVSSGNSAQILKATGNADGSSECTIYNLVGMALLTSSSYITITSLRGIIDLSFVSMDEAISQQSLSVADNEKIIKYMESDSIGLLSGRVVSRCEDSHIGKFPSFQVLNVGSDGTYKIHVWSYEQKNSKLRHSVLSADAGDGSGIDDLSDILSLSEGSVSVSDNNNERLLAVAAGSTIGIVENRLVTGQHDGLSVFAFKGSNGVVFYWKNTGENVWVCTKTILPSRAGLASDLTGLSWTPYSDEVRGALYSSYNVNAGIDWQTFCANFQDALFKVRLPMATVTSGYLELMLNVSRFYDSLSSEVPEAMFLSGCDDSNIYTLTMSKGSTQGVFRVSVNAMRVG